MAIIELTHDYAATPEDVWALAIDFETLAEVCKPLIQFEGLPQGRCETGMKADVMVSIYGKLPAQPYAMEVLECDDAAMVLRSREKGAGVKRWNHTLRVEAHGTGARLLDHIEIDAGFLTPIFVWWGRKLYQHRHKPRQRLLGEA
ncbi:MAG: SRPBCC family protein [Aliishimia sp.]